MWANSVPCVSLDIRRGLRNTSRTTLSEGTFQGLAGLYELYVRKRRTSNSEPLSVERPSALPDVRYRVTERSYHGVFPCPDRLRCERDCSDLKQWFRNDVDNFSAKRATIQA